MTCSSALARQEFIERLLILEAARDDDPEGMDVERGKPYSVSVASVHNEKVVCDATEYAPDSLFWGNGIRILSQMLCL